MVNINLHTHSTFSDGKDSIESLIDKLKSLKYFSITDHDNVESSFYLRKNYQLQNYITGVELTSYIDHHLSGFDYHYALHILAYDFDIDLMQNYLLNWAERRKQAVRNYLVSTNYFNGVISNSESRTDIAKQLVNRHIVKDFMSGIRKINNDTKAEVCIPTIKEVIDAIHACHGYAIWAHPFVILEHSNHVDLSSDQVKQMLSELVKLNIDGIESEYTLFSDQQRSFLNDLAQKNKLLVTTGTDYHGKDGDAISSLSQLQSTHLIHTIVKQKDQIKKVTLRGGRNNHVVKTGSMVQRTIKGNQLLFQGFFKFLNEKKFSFIPKYLGEKDNLNHFEYTQGFVPDNIGRTTINQLVEFMKIVRKMHDLSKEFTKTDQVICHGDLSPCNVVFEGPHIKAIIDWDNIYIGNRWEDISYILWLWINIGSHHKGIQLIVDEIKIGLKAYGSGLDSYKANIVENLKYRMQKVIQDVAPTNPYYQNIKNWVTESIEKIERNRKLFINI
jgi:predicted metal-dependent phosphoesterase TrpH